MIVQITLQHVIQAMAMAATEAVVWGAVAYVFASLWVTVHRR